LQGQQLKGGERVENSILLALDRRALVPSGDNAIIYFVLSLKDLINIELLGGALLQFR
jgi:hypothetical protein